MMAQAITKAQRAALNLLADGREHYLYELAGVASILTLRNLAYDGRLRFIERIVRPGITNTTIRITDAGRQAIAPKAESKAESKADDAEARESRSWEEFDADCPHCGGLARCCTCW